MTKNDGAYPLHIQDVHINQEVLAHIFYNEYSTITVIRDQFTRQNNLSFEPTHYLLSGVGEQVTMHTANCINI